MRWKEKLLNWKDFNFFHFSRMQFLPQNILLIQFSKRIPILIQSFQSLHKISNHQLPFFPRKQLKAQIPSIMQLFQTSELCLLDLRHPKCQFSISLHEIFQLKYFCNDVFVIKLFDGMFCCGKYATLIFETFSNEIYSKFSLCNFKYLLKFC